MRIFDPHSHMISRITDDYEKMAVAGIVAITEPSFWLGEPRKYSGTFYDYFDHITNFERQRAAEYGIQHFCTIGVNPREANNTELAKEVLERMPEWFQHPSVVAVGELGFDLITDEEELILRKQLEMAFEADLPVMIHTPHRNKLEGTERTIRVIQDMKLDPAKILMDHNTEETIQVSKDNGFWCGHTVYPVTKLSPERATAIFQEQGAEMMLVNSSCDWGPSDPLSVPRTIWAMRRQGFTEETIRKIVWDNPIDFYSLSGKVDLKPGWE
ncbi:MAG: TatD family hydrolase [Planctomycetia bacterium]|nr:TatD family hydrolase [Planctomycetia bacterium]MBL6914119.1 TatD family hydrolase [Planctomycetota bacterium]HCW44066.1 hydrolase TatD [Planctomycetota bacterium]